MTVGWTRVVAGTGWVRDRCRMCVDVGVTERGIQDALNFVARTTGGWWGRLLQWGSLGLVGRLRSPALDSKMALRHLFSQVQPERQMLCVFQRKGPSAGDWLFWSANQRWDGEAAQGPVVTSGLEGQSSDGVTDPRTGVTGSAGVPGDKAGDAAQGVGRVCGGGKTRVGDGHSGISTAQLSSQTVLP